MRLVYWGPPVQGDLVVPDSTADRTQYGPATLASHIAQPAACVLVVRLGHGRRSALLPAHRGQLDDDREHDTELWRRAAYRCVISTAS